MYARSTTFNGTPRHIDAGIRFVRSEAAPLLDQVEGCRGLSLLVDRETGQCIATSSWETEEAMRVSDEQLRPIRDRGRDILGGSLQVDEWEIAVMHRTHHGECCRVSWLRGDLNAMTETFRVGILPELEQTPGFCSASLLVNPSAGLGCVTTAWETRAAMEASRSLADEMRSRAASDSPHARKPAMTRLADVGELTDTPRSSNSRARGSRLSITPVTAAQSPSSLARDDSMRLPRFAIPRRHVPQTATCR